MKSKLRKKLEFLVEIGQLYSFTLDEGIKDETGRLVDTLMLEFSTGDTLKISTFCTGFSEGSCFMFTENGNVCSE